MTTQPIDHTETTTSFDLVLPPDPELLRVVRLVASGLASMAPLGLDAVEAVRVAADELVATLIQASDGGPVTITFSISHAALSIRGRVPLVAGAPFELDPLTERILDTVASSHVWQTEDGQLLGQVDQTL
jgi:hypothetical protein